MTFVGSWPGGGPLSDVLSEYLVKLSLSFLMRGMLHLGDGEGVFRFDWCDFPASGICTSEERRWQQVTSLDHDYRQQSTWVTILGPDL